MSERTVISMTPVKVSIQVDPRIDPLDTYDDGSEDFASATTEVRRARIVCALVGGEKAFQRFIADTYSDTEGEVRYALGVLQERCDEADRVLAALFPPTK